eukprot:4734562-Heterocapsa_arctica.AAC.1
MSAAIMSYVEEKVQQFLEFNKGQTPWDYLHETLCNWARQAGGIGYVLYIQMDKLERSNTHKVQKQGHESMPKDDYETHYDNHQMKQVRRSEAERFRNIGRDMNRVSGGKRKNCCCNLDHKCKLYKLQR